MILRDPVEVALPDDAATARLGAAVAGLLREGGSVLLWGDLGAGKSTLARGLVRALTRPEEDVPSPTFTLMQQYDARPFLTHFDLYRLADERETIEVGLDEALDEGAIVVEWPQRMGDRLPPDRLDIELEILAEGRRARLVPHGAFIGREFHV